MPKMRMPGGWPGEYSLEGEMAGLARNGWQGWSGILTGLSGRLSVARGILFEYEKNLEFGRICSVIYPYRTNKKGVLHEP